MEDVTALRNVKFPLQFADEDATTIGDNASEGGEVITILSAEAALADLVTVRFASPVSGVDPFDGVDFISNRHRLAAVWTRQDASETVFINEEGEILARWRTKLIRSIEWPSGNGDGEVDGPNLLAAEGSPTHRVGTGEWLNEIKSRHPRAYEPWPVEEDEDLRAEVGERVTVAEIAARHQRRPSAIRSRLRKLGLE